MAHRRLASTTVARPLLRTPLHDLHVRHEGQMVGFAGYSMPLAYPKSQTISESHLWTRARASIFDVAHMVQQRFVGARAGAFLESLTPTSLQTLPPMSSTLTVFLNERGGIVDDAIVTKWKEDEYYVVTNAGCREKDAAYFAAHLGTGAGRDVAHERLDGRGLIALQGPRAAAALQELTSADLSSLYFGSSAWVNVSKLDCKVHVARGGYTGEDGFEISVDGSQATGLAELLLRSLDNETVKLAGLAARDSLRLEAGMCLYGHDLSEDINPAEAGLAWLVSKARRSGPNPFPGSAQILRSLAADSDTVRRVGLLVADAPAREGATIHDATGVAVGRVTSGCPSPSLHKNIAMGYVPRRLAKAGTPLSVHVRGKPRAAIVAKLPFVEPNYYRRP